MRLYDKLENLSQYQRWALVSASLLPPAVISYIAVEHSGDVLAGLFLFYVPVTLSVVLLGHH